MTAKSMTWLWCYRGLEWLSSSLLILNLAILRKIREQWYCLLQQWQRLKEQRHRRFHFSRSEDLMEEELYRNFIPNNLLTGPSSNNLPLFFRIFWYSVDILMLGRRSEPLLKWLAMLGSLSAYCQILKDSQDVNISKENRGHYE